MPGSLILSFGPYQLDFEKVQLWCDTQPVRLTPKAFQVLCYLVERPGQLVTKDELFRVVWIDTVVGDAALTMCIQEIRKALGDTPKSPQYVETVHRLGFRFIASVAAYAAPPVPSSEFQVPSQEEESQKPVLSPSTLLRINSIEGGNDEKTEQANGEMQALEPLPSFPSRLEPVASSLPRDSGLSTQHSPSSRFTRGFVLAAVLLLTATILTVQYLSRPSLSTQSSALITQEAQLPLPDNPSIVVLPFANLSGDASQEYFNDGITEVLTTDLSKVSNLFVISCQSAFIYKGRTVKVQDVSKEMGVRYVLEGGVQKSNGQVRIMARLIDAATGYHLWSESYDRPLTDIFALQEDIVQKIVMTLKLQFTAWRLGEPARKSTNNTEAYDYLLRATAFHRQLTPETNRQTRQLVEQALALDPQYANAYVLLGWTYYMEWVWRWTSDSQSLERALELAQQAIALDDFDSGSHILLAAVYTLKAQINLALAEVERAIALDASSAENYAMQAQVLLSTDKPEEALQAAQKAIRLTPYAPIPDYFFTLGWAYFFLDRYAESIAALKQALAHGPNFLSAYPMLADNYILQWVGQLSPDPQLLTQAYEAAQQAVTLNDAFPYAHIALGIASLYQKQYDLAIAEFERVVSLDATSGCAQMLLASVLSGVGKIDEAVPMAEKGLRLVDARADRCTIAVGGIYALAGRFEEARTVLQRLLLRYPNFLPGHLELATVYSELSQEAEARAEAAEVLRLNPKFSLELYKQRMPIKDPAVLERHIAALRKAGLK